MKKMSPPKKKDQQNNKKLKIVLMPNSAVMISVMFIPPSLLNKRITFPVKLDFWRETPRFFYET